jgi:site-specific DNA-methyltransferase (adenine-specific)
MSAKIELHNIDCMEYLATLKDNAFELAIVDPPYGIGEHGGKNRASKSNAWKNPKQKDYKKKEWDKKPMDAFFFTELKRVTKNQIIWGANHFADNFNASSSGWVCWYKAGQNPNTDFSPIELAYSSFKKRANFFDFPWLGFGAVNAKEKRIHPTQKPVKLYEWLLMNYAKEGDRILDTHLGSGSIAIACHNLGFDLVGCELDKDYFEAAQKRLQQHQSQLRIPMQ